MSRDMFDEDPFDRIERLSVEITKFNKRSGGGRRYPPITIRATKDEGKTKDGKVRHPGRKRAVLYVTGPAAEKLEDWTKVIFSLRRVPSNEQFLRITPTDDTRLGSKLQSNDYDNGFHVQLPVDIYKQIPELLNGATCYTEGETAYLKPKKGLFLNISRAVPVVDD